VEIQTEFFLYLLAQNVKSNEEKILFFVSIYFSSVLLFWQVML